MKDKRPGKRALIVGLTGGIGSGKSEALRCFGGLGADTMSLDAVARRALLRGAAAYRAVVRAFGPGVLDARGEIDRRALGRLVFGDLKARRRLERLTHPAIIRQMRRRIKAQRRGVLVVDAPLLYEAALEREFHMTMVVAASRGRRLARLRRRDGLPKAQLRLRMAAQLPLRDKVRRADVVLDNDGSREELRRKIREYHKAFGLMHGG